MLQFQKTKPFYELNKLIHRVLVNCYLFYKLYCVKDLPKYKCKSNINKVLHLIS